MILGTPTGGADAPPASVSSTLDVLVANEDAEWSEETGWGPRTHGRHLKPLAGSKCTRIFFRDRFVDCKLRGAGRSHDSVNCRIDASVVVAALELRGHQVANNAPRRDVWKCAFEPITNLNAHLSIVGNHENQYPIVCVLSAQFPAQL